MVFSSYNSTSYLPLDNDQSVTFYKNENRLFPTAIVPPTVLALPPSTRGADSSAASNSLSHMSNMSTTDMLTAAYEQQQQQHHHQHHRELIGGSGSGTLITGDCPFGRVQSPATASATPQQLPVAQHQHHHRPGGAVAMCDDFQPVAYLNGSSNGYYGYVPALTPAATDQNNRQNTIAGRGETGVRRSQDPTTIAPPAVHLSSVRFHGNGNSDDNELNNNNNNNEQLGGEVVAADPFSAGSFLQHARKRKEHGGFAMNLHQRYEEEDMDTNAPVHTFDGASETKRRRTEPEVFPERTNDFRFPADNVGDSYSHEQQAQQQQQAVEMECQDQQEQHHLTGHSHPEQPSPPAVNYTNGFHSQHTPDGLLPASSPFATAPARANGHQHQHLTGKSKYFDSSRCMMSHMI